MTVSMQDTDVRTWLLHPWQLVCTVQAKADVYQSWLWNGVQLARWLCTARSNAQA